jgi:hypothetical protein
MKARDCPELGPLKIGEFGRYPNFDSVVCPGMFSVDLVRAARNTVRFLAGSEGITMTAKSRLHTCTVRLPLFFKLQAAKHARIGNVFLLVKTSNSHKMIWKVPPLDVAIVWFSLMLQRLIIFMVIVFVC